LSLQSIPGEKFEGLVTHIDPFIHPKTRVANVRIELTNQGLKLKPEMFANGILHSEVAESSDQLIIPKSAILWTGKRAVVYIKVPDRDSPTFIYREVTLGAEAGSFYVIADGLMEGEEIAVNGVFKIDAAAQLEGKPSMMNPGGGKVSLAHDHGSQGVKDTEDHSAHEEMEMTVEPVEVSADFKVQLQKVYDEYNLMKDAFVATDAKKVRKAAVKVESSLQNVDMGLLKGDSHMIWMENLTVLKAELSAISGTSDISLQRISFAVFNDAFYASLKTFGLAQGTVYYQYCPMANGDKGAYWLSNIEEINNPYFGDEMLRCGETKETLDY
jgi:Cu(I)/Ag(I) efflux system membrane fusion protein